MKDYQINEKIISAKIDSFEWIQKSLDYKYRKAIRSWNDLNGGKIIFILYHFVAPDYWYNMFFLCADSPLIFEIGDLKTTDIDWSNDAAWTAGQYIDYYNFWRNTSPEEFVDLENDPEYASISNDYKPFHFLTKNYSSCHVIKATSYTRQAVLNYLRDTYYDQMDLELKPLPDYYSEGELLSVDEYGSKIIEKHPEEIQVSKYLWFPGDFPQTPLFHAMFVDGHTFYIPNQFTLDEYTHNAISERFPDLLFLQIAYQELCWIKLVLSRHSLVAYGKEMDYQPYLTPLSARAMANLYIITEQNKKSWTKGYANWGMRVELVNQFITTGRGITVEEVTRNYGLVPFTYISTNTPDQTHEFIQGVSRFIDDAKWRSDLTPLMKLGGV